MPSARQSQECRLILGLLLFTLTACATHVPHVPAERPDDRNGQWNDTDARVTAEALIQEALDHPWSQRFVQVDGRRPVVMVGTVLNRTHEPLNTQGFVKELERALQHSERVQSVTDAGQRPAVVKPGSQEVKADFVLQGTINALVDELDSKRAISYQVDLELINIASNVKVWLGQKQIKKLVERSKTTL